MMQTLIVNRDIHQSNRRTLMNSPDVLRGLAGVQINQNNFRQLSLGLLGFVVVGFGKGILFP